jgi:hypothetical protein
MEFEKLWLNQSLSTIAQKAILFINEINKADISDKEKATLIVSLNITVAEEAKEAIIKYNKQANQKIRESMKIGGIVGGKNECRFDVKIDKDTERNIEDIIRDAIK